MPNGNSTSKPAFANLTDATCSMISDLEHKLQKETGQAVALVAYQIQ